MSWVPRLPADDVHLWYELTGHLAEADITVAMAALSPDERARCERFVFARDRRDFARAHAMVRHVLSTHLGLAPGAVMFEVNRYGKPRVRADRPGGPEVVFNLAHTDGLVACAVARGTDSGPDIGVDVEMIRREVDYAGISSWCLSPTDADTLAASPASERTVRFIELWTLKEAYVKAIGSGLALPLAGFGFEFEGASEVRLRRGAGATDEEWQFALFAPSDQHRMAVAIRCAPGRRRIVARAYRPCAEARVLLPQRFAHVGQ